MVRQEQVVVIDVYHGTVVIALNQETREDVHVHCLICKSGALRAIGNGLAVGQIIAGQEEPIIVVVD